MSLGSSEMSTPELAPPLGKKRCTRSSGSVVENLAAMYNNYKPHEPSLPGRPNVLVLGMEFVTQDCFDLVRRLFLRDTGLLQQSHSSDL
jgi:hypothetical protein